jgi:hypothetical protein
MPASYSQCALHCIALTVSVSVCAAGLLEKKEAAAVMNQVERRMKYMHMRYAVE